MPQQLPISLLTICQKKRPYHLKTSKNKKQKSPTRGKDISAINSIIDTLVDPSGLKNFLKTKISSLQSHTLGKHTKQKLLIYLADNRLILFFCLIWIPLCFSVSSTLIIIMFWWWWTRDFLPCRLWILIPTMKLLYSLQMLHTTLPIFPSLLHSVKSELENLIKESTGYKHCLEGMWGCQKGQAADRKGDSPFNSLHIYLIALPQHCRKLKWRANNNDVSPCPILSRMPYCWVFDERHLI